jgi:hypothetical protein
VSKIFNELSRKPTRSGCQKLWDSNRRYVADNAHMICSSELIQIALEQDALYLAWFDGDFSKLGLPQNATIGG